MKLGTPAPVDYAARRAGNGSTLGDHSWVTIWAATKTDAIATELIARVCLFG
jgi:hypothetical protein